MFCRPSFFFDRFEIYEKTGAVARSVRTVASGEDGFEGKDRSWNSKELLEDWRESWTDHANSYLREIEAAQKLDRDPLPDIGWKAWGWLEDVRELVSGLRTPTPVCGT